MAVNIDRLIHIQHAVHSPAERMQDVVRIFSPKTTQHDPRLVCLVVAVRVLEMDNFRTVGNVGAAIPRFNTGRDQQAISKHCRLVGGSVTISIFEDQDLVRCLLSGGNLRIDLRRRDPQPPASVEVDLDRFVQLRIGSKQIDFESFWKHKRLAFLFGIGNRNVFQVSLSVDGS